MGPTVEQVDTYHGTKVPDPFRWLESTDSAATREWLAHEDRRAEEFFARTPVRQALRERLAELWSFERYGVPVERGGWLFFTKNDGRENQARLFATPVAGGPDQLLVDPNPLDDAGTVALTGFEPSEDGRLLAYGLSARGSDWTDWRVRDLERGVDLPEIVRWVRFSSLSWLPDSSGFFYSRYDEPRPGEEHAGLLESQKLFFHRVGTPQEADLLIYYRPDHPDWGYDGLVAPDGRFLWIRIWQGTDRRSRIHYLELTAGREPGGEVHPLLDDFDAGYTVVTSRGREVWLWTDAGAPCGRVVAVHLDRPGRGDWREILAERSAVVLSAHVVGDRLVTHSLVDAKCELELFDLAGRPLGQVPLPGLGTVGAWLSRPDQAVAYFSYTSFSHPLTVFRYDSRTGEVALFRTRELPFDPELYVTRQVFFESCDGTRVPMTLAHRRDLDWCGDNPTLLHGYGGFAVSMTPTFTVGHLAWLELGGVLALANLRGGGEYGEAWHLAGTRRDKQNVFDDFASAARWLIDAGITRPERLAISGRSNGGLLVGAAITQNPDLFGAAIAHVGVFDMVRFPRFTIGWAWISDYGSPDDPDDFAALLAYSPYHNVRPGTAYPPTLVITGDHDDRVVPVHSFKFAAALRAAQAGDAPILLRVERSAGHGAGKPSSKVIDEAADSLAFLIEIFELDGP
jgi:prolyl oligopeptidase